MNKKVSVLIPSYNHAKYVSHALDSIVNDSYPDKEIVIIDDGSSDNSVEVIQDWIRQNAEKIDIIFSHRENRGINATLNEMRNKATGQYLTVMASDDYLLPDSISKRMAVFFAHPEKYVVFGDAHVVDEQGTVILNSSIEDYHHGNKSSLMTDEGILDAALFRPVFSGSLEIMNKDVYLQIGDYPQNISMEDWFFWQRVSINNLVIFIDDYVCCYRRHGGNSTAYSRFPLKVEKDVLLTCKMNLSLIKDLHVKRCFQKAINKRQLKYFMHKTTSILEAIKATAKKNVKLLLGILLPQRRIDRSVHFTGKKYISIGPKTMISQNTWLNVNAREGRKRIILGDYDFIGRNNFFSSGALIELGDYVITSVNCCLIGSQHTYVSPETPYLFSPTESCCSIKIGHNCFIGANATIMGNVTIGMGSLIGVNAFVRNMIVLPFSVVIGSEKAKVVKRYSFVTKEWKDIYDWNEADEQSIPTEEAYLLSLKVKMKELYPGHIPLPLKAVGKSNGNAYL